MGITFLPDRLKAEGIGSAEGDGAGVTIGDDGGVKKVTSGSVGRFRGGGGNTEGSRTSGTSEAVGTVTGVAGGGAGVARTSGAVLAEPGAGGDCETMDGGEGPGSVGVTEENFLKN